MYKKINGCRACGYGKVSDLSYVKDQANEERLVSVFNLGVQPLANDFKDHTQEQAGFAPLEALFCPRCTLGQLSVVVKPEILYANYPYVTSRSETMRKHFDSLMGDIWFEEPGVQSVIEIGSNDGFFLKCCKDAGIATVLGVDGAENLAKIAEADGVPTVKKFFNCDVAGEVHNRCVDPDVIVARHVLCHIDDWRDFVRGLRVIMGKDTLVFVEVPYAGDMLARAEFDSIYHEHLSYMTLKAMEALLRGSGLHMHRILHYGIHGGAVGIMLRRDDSGVDPDSSVWMSLSSENITQGAWAKFSMDVNMEMQRLLVKLSGLQEAGKVVCGYGASAKSTVWLNAMKLTRREVRFVTDNTPQKLYKNVPGTDIPVLDEGAIVREKPDAIILFAWNYAKEILTKEKAFTDGGGQFIIPHANA